MVKAKEEGFYGGPAYGVNITGNDELEAFGDNGDAIVFILYEILSLSLPLTQSQFTVQLARELDKRSVRRTPPIIIHHCYHQFGQKKIQS